MPPDPIDPVTFNLSMFIINNASDFTCPIYSFKIVDFKESTKSGMERINENQTMFEGHEGMIEVRHSMQPSIRYAYVHYFGKYGELKSGPVLQVNQLTKN